MIWKNIIALTFSALTLTSCHLVPDQYPQSGVSHGLAKERASRISGLRYALKMDVPQSRDEAITAESQIQFALSSTSDDLFLDFKADSTQLVRIILNGDTLEPRIINEHIKLPSSSLRKDNDVNIDFLMGNGPLNRNDNYFYALFVPDRARTAIPCFDQPDIKGEFSVVMTIPEHWKGIANGPQTINQALGNGRKTVEFAHSKPLSTYLWAYAAGEFEYTSKPWKNTTIGLYHMVDDTAKYNRNKDRIFEQTIESLNWLEDYTDYPYPYDNYNLVAIPSFQFNGMEHPGATYYRSESIFLEENPTPNEELSRANLIAHETAHMWFGDLVTMPWFDEVWLKEVFANYMAGKIAQPWFADINHQLRFLLAHFPSAYSVDRTLGANPINQELANLENAGTLYGSIIYHKSPIVMAQLETMVGSENLQKGIQEYVRTNAFKNASWDNLIDCIDKLTENDLKIWSHSWVNKPGRPVISMTPPNENSDSWQIKQFPEHSQLSAPETFWPQEITTYTNNQTGNLPLLDKTLETDESIAKASTLIFADDKGYGLFRMNDAQINYWMKNTSNLEDPLLRGRSAINLYENYLDASIPTNPYFNFLIEAIEKEDVPLLVNLYRGQLKTVFWHFIKEDERLENSTYIINKITQKASTTTSIAIKKYLFQLWINISMDNNTLNQMAELIDKDKTYFGVPLNEIDRMDLVSQLAIKNYPGWETLYNKVVASLHNEDRKAMMAFSLPALSNDEKVRDDFWQSLTMSENRKKENWVKISLEYLHHPLRQKHSISYLGQTLEKLEEIQETGDIFFPIGWLYYSIGQYSSDQALDVVNHFLNEHPQYPEHLKTKILQNINLAERAGEIRTKE